MKGGAVEVVCLFKPGSHEASHDAGSMSHIDGQRDLRHLFSSPLRAM